MTRFTHIIVGAGSAGCCLAARLSEDAANNVLLLEAGGRDWNPMLHIPMGSGKLLRRGLHGWKFTTEPDPGLDGRAMFWPRGRVLGGSSSINGLVYVRGHPSDYDAWAQMGNRGWSFAEVLPYFKRSEGHETRGGPFHGTQGPLHVAPAKSPNPLYGAFVEAGREAGFPVCEDFNGSHQEGFGRYDFNIRDGRRCSAAVAFLRPARGRPNLTVRIRAEVVRILMEGHRAVGVVYRHRRALVEARTDGEVVLCAGVIKSPHLLMLSGIGDPDHLNAHGIAVAVPLPGVGRNLQDHQTLPVRFGCSQPVTLHQTIRFDRAAVAMLQAALLRNGPATSFPTEAGAFVRSRAGLEAPDLQLHLTITLGASRLRVPLLSAVRRDPLDREGFTIMVSVLRPESHGRVRLRSADPFVNPCIEANYLASAGDRALFRRGVGIVRRLARQNAFAPFIADELAPGPEVTSDDGLDRWARGAVITGQHQVGTCQMGSGADAVVDDRLRVHGARHLRVVDASVMPRLVGGNTHAPTVMIAEKAADMIRGRPPPEPEA